MRAGRVGIACLWLAACDQMVVPSAPAGPLTMPPADGRLAVVSLSPSDYAVSRRKIDRGIVLRVTRSGGRDLDYSEGRLAKRAAEAYCAEFNRTLDPAAAQRFSAPNSWIFLGDCL